MDQPAVVRSGKAFWIIRMPLKHLGYPGRSLQEPPEDEPIEDPEPRKPEEMVDLTKSRLDGSSGRAFFIHLTDATWVPDMDVVKKSFDENFTKIESKEFGKMEITIYSITRPSP
ncbi:hypothetical protein ACFL6S_26420 [Candidatus Poribacteria bacterium]